MTAELAYRVEGAPSGARPFFVKEVFDPGQEAQDRGRRLETQGFRIRIRPGPVAVHFQKEYPFLADGIFRRQVESHIFPATDVLGNVRAIEAEGIDGTI